MHIRVSTRRRGDKVYRYTQLVQSYRRPDGMPAHKVLASLGERSEAEVENLRRALKAARKGQLVVLPDEITQHLSPRKVQANLQYLDIAVVSQLWDQWKLGVLLDELLPKAATDIPTSAVLQALVTQRCVAPNSKIQAQRWYPKTALPELQGIVPGKVRNTRIHRSLEQLEMIEAPLQERLARRIHSRGPLTALYLDATDTWFVGRGPDLAHNRITKEGMLRRRIGIVLLCDARGYPLRWATVAGNHNESTSMMDMLRQVAAQPWMEQVPLVADRAMGRGVTIGALCAHGIRFVTAVPVHEIPSYSSQIPLGAFDGLGVDGKDRDDPNAHKRLRQAAVERGFERVTDTRYVHDLGELERTEGPPVTGLPQESLVSSSGHPTRAVTALRVAYRIQQDLDAGVASSLDKLAPRYGVSPQMMRIWASLLGLTDEVQRRIMEGAADRLPLNVLVGVASLEPTEQLAALDEAHRESSEAPVLWPVRALKKIAGSSSVRIRGVLLFNPERFLEQRQTAQEHLRKLEEFVTDLNRRLRSPSSRRKRDSVLAAVGGELRHRSWLDLFEIHVESESFESRSVQQVRLVRNDEAWRLRRRADGLTLIVTHPDVMGTAAEVATLYFAKDKVEKDFQTIKSVLELRPVRHRTDTKVRAHVTLCMLALLLERSLERQLGAGGLPMTAAAALAELRSVHLNQYAGAPEATYSVTQLAPDQRSILAALGLEDLASDDAVSQTITPR